MDVISPYNLLIETSVILIVSFFFGEVSKKTSIPSVILLIALGIVAKLILDYFDVEELNFLPLLEILGIVGLIMIVLEAALELKLTKENIAPISIALAIALVGLLLSTWLTAIVLKYFIADMSNLQAWIYATPLSILSSAIIIPSVIDLKKVKKEFHIYESTFSDILGIMLFYFLTSQLGGEDHGGGASLSSYGLTVLLTIVLSIIFSYLIVIVFQNIRSNVKLFLLISVLLLLYAVGKKMHLSSLIIILIFGLVISNMPLFFQGKLAKLLKPEKAHHIYEGLHVITMETAFVVRTFFFVVFGMTISFGDLSNPMVIGISILLLLIIYVVRFLLLRVSIGTDIIPQLFIAPRGLITILLFYAIPETAHVEGFNQGILLFIIIGTSIIMTFSMIYNKRRSSTAIRQVKSLPVDTVRWKAPGLD
ncbi:MAG: cation:proton antiporter [Saprospiraceae bacterium]|nr:cation:proton antiporter [Saprospiraceae bacterium]